MIGCSHPSPLGKYIRNSPSMNSYHWPSEAANFFKPSKLPTGNKSTNTLMSLLIRCSHIPFYFHFSFTSSTLLIHHHAPLHWCDHMQLCSRSHNICTWFIGPISLIWWTHDLWFTWFTSILSIPNVRPPTVRPITSPHTARSGTYYSFALDEPYACLLVYHSYLTCLYLPFAPYTRARESPIWVSPRIEI